MTDPTHTSIFSISSRMLTWLFSCALLVTVVAIVTLASVPPVDRDALTHHLFVPKLYLQHGSIYEIPEIIFSYYPMNLDLLYMFPLYFGNDIIPKYIHFVFALLTSYLVFRFLRTRIGMNWGLLGALFFLSIPVIIKLSITVYVDLGLVFFSTAALLSFIEWQNNPAHKRFLVLCGLCAGLAAGTKYNGLIVIVILALLIPYLYSRYSRQYKKEQRNNSQIKAVLFGLIFLLAASLTYGPWLARNYIWTGNPVYPMHNNLFNPSTAKVHDQKTTSQNGSIEKESQDSGTQNIQDSGTQNIFVTRRMLYNESALETLFLPVRFFFQGQDDNPRYFDGKLNPFLLLLPLCALLTLRKDPNYPNENRELLILFSFALLYFFFVFFQTSMRVRYIAPSLPPLVILSVLGLHNLCSYIGQRTIKLRNIRAYSLLVAALTGFILLPNFSYLKNQFSIVEPLSYISGKLNRNAYITKFRPEFPAISWLNSKTEGNSKVLCVFLGNRGYYMDFTPTFTNPFISGLHAKVEGHEYVLLRNDLFEYWLSKNKQSYTRQNLPFDLEKPIFNALNYSVYRL